MLIYAGVQFYLYVKNEYYMKPVWKYINLFIVLCCIFFTTAYGGLTGMGTYLGISLSFCITLFFLWAYSIF